MTEDNKGHPSRTKPKDPLRLERVAISNENLARIKSWINQATADRAGIEVNLKKLVNWAVGQIPEKLESSHLRDISANFYDEVKFLESALIQMKQVKAQGGKMTLQDIYNANRGVQKKSSSKPKTPTDSSNPSELRDKNSQQSKLQLSASKNNSPATQLAES